MANPALSESRFSNLEVVANESVMTLNGTINKTAISLCLLLVAGSIGFSSLWAQGMYIPCAIIAFIVAIITMFKPNISPVTVPIYAIIKGLCLGALSNHFTNNPIVGYEGIVQQAITLTMAIFIAMLFLYKKQIIKPSQTLFSVIFSAGAGIVLFSVIHCIIVWGFNGDGFFFWDPQSQAYGGLVSIGISLFIIIIGALFFVWDFHFIEKSCKNKVPKYMEWYGAFALLLTIVWLYVEILRLLSKLRSR